MAAAGKLLWNYDPEIWKHNPIKMLFGLRRQPRRGLRRRADLLGGAGRPAVRARRKDRQAALERGDHHASTRCRPSPARRASSTARSSSAMPARTSARAAMSPPMTPATGKQVWRFYVAPGTPEENRGDPAMERAAATWRGEYWKTGTGGAVWDSITLRSGAEPHLSRHRQRRPVRSRGAQPGRRRQSLHRLDRRARRRHRQIRLALPGQSARCLGLRLHPADDAGRPASTASRARC